MAVLYQNINRLYSYPLMKNFPQNEMFHYYSIKASIYVTCIDVDLPSIEVTGWALRTNTYLKKFQIKSYFIHKYFSILSIEGQTKGVAPEYCCIAALRGLELKNNNPAMWNRLQLLMDHGDENKKSEMEYYEMFKVFVV